LVSLPDSVNAPLVVQLTDSHLFARANGRLLGIDTAASLQQVVAQVVQEQPRIDLLLASGDLSQDGSVASYQRFCELTEPLAAPMRWLAGNHDENAPMAKACGDRDFLDTVTDLGAWRLILLDSTVRGCVFGELEQAQLATLDEALSAAPERPALICLHHHPVPVGCGWMEPLGLNRPDELFAVLDRHPQVKVVLWGHIHQEFDQLRNGVRLLASPSTGLQFEPGSQEFKAGDQAPGYRWLRLLPDGELETGVSRLQQHAFTVDHSAAGY